MSRNIIWGKQKSGEAGHVAFQYKKLLGYRRGPDGGPEIVPEEAEMVRRIFRRYLEGASLGDIKKELEADGVPTAEAVEGWSYQVIRNILTNGCAIIGPNQQTLVVQAVALIWFTYGSKESTGGDSRNSSYHAAGLVFAG